MTHLHPQPSDWSEGGTQPTQAHSTPHDRAALGDAGGDARLGARTAGGGRRGDLEGTPPSNTVPSNCISGGIGDSPYFQALRFGVDSLYLSYQGTLDEEEDVELNRLKKVAQSPETFQQVTAQLARAGHIFEVKDKGSRLYPYILEDNAFRIQLSRSKGNVPMAYVKLSSAFLAHHKPTEAEAHLRNIVSQFGELEGDALVSRIDLFVDFVSSVDMESWDRSAWVTRARSVTAYALGEAFSGWSVGMGGIISARLYNKSLEVEGRPNDYIHDLWRQVGWDGHATVWRLEFELKREVLTQHGLSTLYDTLPYLNGLWSYATTEWLRLTLPSHDDQTRSRWPIHPLWGYLSSVDFEGDGGPISKRFTLSRAPSEEKMLTFGFTMIINFMAKNGIRDLYDGLKAFEAAMYAYHDHKSFELGLSFDDYVAERVSIKVRQFNTMMNPVAEDDPEQVIQQAAKAYRKASGRE